MIDLLITLALVFLNGFFVAAEFAIVKVRASQLELRAGKGQSQAKLALHILNNLNAYLSASQLGITLASLGLGWIGEPVVADGIINIMHYFDNQINEELAHQIAVPIAFAIITVLHIVVGEQAPKSLALVKSEPVTLFVAYPLRFFYFIFRPAIWLLNSFSNWLVSLMGFSLSDHSDVHSAEELQFLLDQGKVTGAIAPSEHELIKNIFGFNRINARQIMTPRPNIQALDIESSMDEMMAKIVHEGYSRMPIFKENIDNIVGVVYTKDLLKMMQRNEAILLENVMRTPFFVPETKRVNELLKELQSKRMHMAIVTDEFGGVAGIITIEDILEELVGEIQDEHDEEPPVVEKINEKEFVVSALASIEDVNEFLPLKIEKESDFDTLAGLVTKLFGKIPEVGEKTRYEGYEIQILKKSKQSVSGVKLILLPR